MVNAAAFICLQWKYLKKKNKPSSNSSKFGEPRKNMDLLVIRTSKICNISFLFVETPT